jgi:MoaA/NifB/PqqE/SkfB family radical SAM enzyme
MKISLKHILRPIFNIYSLIFGLSAKWLHPYFPLTPLRLSVYITKKCNLTCPHCYTKDALNTPEPNALTFNEWKKIVDSIPRTTVIDFCGGEIFFSPHMLPLLEYMSRKKRLISIITNGTTITEKIVDSLIDQQITYYMTSIDGMELYHDNIRGKKGTFERATNMIRYMQKQKKLRKSKYPMTCIKTVITEDNFNEIPKLLHFAEHELGVENIQFALVYNNKSRMVFESFEDMERIPNLPGNTYDYPEDKKEDIKNLLRYIVEYKKTSNMFIGLDPRLPDDNMLVDYIDNQNNFGVKDCNRHWSEYFLHYDGKVTSCITYDLGNIRDVDYDVTKVLNRPKVKKFLKYMDSQMPFIEECRSCCKGDHSPKPEYTS